MRDTAASITSPSDFRGPSGTPSVTEVSTSDKASSSESDQSSSSGIGAIWMKKESAERSKKDGTKVVQKSMNVYKKGYLLVHYHTKELGGNVSDSSSKCSSWKIEEDAYSHG